MLDLLAVALAVGLAAGVGTYFGFQETAGLAYLSARIKARKKIRPHLLEALEKATSEKEARDLIAKHHPELFSYLERHGVDSAFFHYFFSELDFVLRNSPPSLKRFLRTFIRRYAITNLLLKLGGREERYPVPIEEEGEGALGQLRLRLEEALLKSLLREAQRMGDQKILTAVRKYVRLCEFRFVLRAKMEGQRLESLSKHLLHPSLFSNLYQSPLKEFVQEFLSMEGLRESRRLYLENFSLSEMEAGFERDFAEMMKTVDPLSPAFVFLYLLRLEGYLSRIRAALYRARWKECGLL